MSAVELDLAREQVAGAARALAGHGLVSGTAGNVSLRVGAKTAITPAGSDLGRLDADDVVLVAATGELVAGAGRPSSELALHLAAPAAAVVHTHSPYASVLSCFGEEVPPVHYLMASLGGPIRVARYATFGTEELARGAVEALRDRNAALLANHGAVVVASDLSEAVARAVLLESSCAIAYRARVLGGPRTLAATELREVVEAEAAASEVQQ
jgi:L-fuculose-phosphate aldolase